MLPKARPWAGEGSIVGSVVEVPAGAAGRLALRPNRQNNHTAEAAEAGDLVGEVGWGKPAAEERTGWVACSSSPAKV
jgi:hypothetical protein